MLSRRFLILNVVQAEVRLRKGPRAPSKWSNRVMEQSSKWSTRVMELTAEEEALGTLRTCIIMELELTAERKRRSALTYHSKYCWILNCCIVIVSFDPILAQVPRTRAIAHKSHCFLPHSPVQCNYSQISCFTNFLPSPPWTDTKVQWRCVQ